MVEVAAVRNVVVSTEGQATLGVIIEPEILIETEGHNLGIRFYVDSETQIRILVDGDLLRKLEGCRKLAFHFHFGACGVDFNSIITKGVMTVVILLKFDGFNCFAVDIQFNVFVARMLLEVIQIMIK